MDKKGLVLVLVLGVLVVSVLLASTFVSLTNSEIQMVRHETNSIRAFYLAEAGIEEAIYKLKLDKDDDFKGSLYSSAYEYEVDIEEEEEEEDEEDHYVITSTGAYPDLDSQAKVVRKVKVDVSVKPNGNLSSVTNAIEANGTISTSGSVDINGSTEENANPDFQSVFGITKDQMSAMANNKYTDPSNNTTPVNQITWVDLVNNPKFTVSQTGWSGSGILVVVEPAGSTQEALEITGGAFEGVIWVIGNLRISGNANISGAIFVENAPGEVARFTGSAQISYDSSDVKDAFEYLGNSIDSISNWQEVFS